MSGHPNEPPPPYPGMTNAYSTPKDYNSFGPATNYPPADPNNPYKGGYVPEPQQPYGAPPPAQYAPSTHHHATVVVAQPAVTLVQTFRDTPVHTRCNHCSAEIVTGIHYETGTFTWIICFVLWLVGCGLGCCLIPFCVDGCKDVIHTCPNCHQHIARFTRM